MMINNTQKTPIPNKKALHIIPASELPAKSLMYTFLFDPATLCNLKQDVVAF